MNAEELRKLPSHELLRIKNRNYVLFHLVSALDLLIFYYSIFAEKWVLLFTSFGIFIATLALYDNYRLSRDLLRSQAS